MDYILELINKGDLERANDHFIRECGRLTLNDMLYLVNLGIDPRYENDRPFIYCFMEDHSTVGAEYLLVYFDADINAYDGGALDTAAIAKNLRGYRFLLENGIRVTDSAITAGLKYIGTPVITLLVQHGINPQRIADLLEKEISTDGISAENQLKMRECLSRIFIGFGVSDSSDESDE